MKPLQNIGPFKLYLDLKLPCGGSYRFPLRKTCPISDFEGEIFFKDILDAEIESEKKDRKTKYWIQIHLRDKHPCGTRVFTKEFHGLGLAEAIRYSFYSRISFIPTKMPETSDSAINQVYQPYFDILEKNYSATNEMSASHINFIKKQFNNAFDPLELYHITRMHHIYRTKHPFMISAFDRNEKPLAIASFANESFFHTVFDQLQASIKILKFLECPYDKIIA